MMSLRGKYSRAIFVFLTGVAFLNMSFILAEIDTMGLTKDSALIQNLISAGAEEEKDSSKTGFDDLKEVYLDERNEIYQHAFFLIALQRNSSEESDKPLAAHNAKFCPPPEAF